MLKKLETLLNNEIDPAFAERARFIFEKIEEKKPKRVLDMGCGRGFYTNSFSLYTFPEKIYGLDIRKEYIEKAEKGKKDSRIQFSIGNIYKTFFPDNFFDMIICSEIFEHLEDDKKALIEMKRILKKDGVLIITVPNYNFPFLWDPLNWIIMRVFKTHVSKNIWWLAGIWADHERLYTEEQLRKLAKNNDFTIQESKSFVASCWPFSHFLLYGIGKNLVEKCGLTSYDRFNMDSKSKGPNLLAAFFRLPNKLFPVNTGSLSVDLAFVLQK